MFIADFHIHSKYSRATSSEMMIPKIAEYARLKGISLIGSGDFTHGEWLKELKNYLKEAGPGLNAYNNINFILVTEVNNMYTRNARLRRIHNMIFAPDFDIAEKINKFLGKYGKLQADGRPTLSLDSYEMLEGLLAISKDVFVVPSHIWTPWFSLFGANSGFDSIEECFGDLSNEIFALETGLSSDPAMNWRLSTLDRLSLISNSDAHSPNRLGREANVFKEPLNYYELKDVLKKKDKDKFLFTIEYFPEEGKYHYDGHRKCKIRFSPEESRINNNICPVCSRPLTVGVLHRVENLGDRDQGYTPDKVIPYKNTVPLEEIIAEALDLGRDTVGVGNEYRKLVSHFGSEFEIQFNIPIDELKKFTTERIALAVDKVRRGDLIINPGYDGEFGEVKIFTTEGEEKEPQLGLF